MLLRSLAFVLGSLFLISNLSHTVEAVSFKDRTVKVIVPSGSGARITFIAKSYKEILEDIYPANQKL